LSVDFGEEISFTATIWRNNEERIMLNKPCTISLKKAIITTAYLGHKICRIKVKKSEFDSWRLHLGKDPRGRQK
jgi:hypothetical protein